MGLPQVPIVLQATALGIFGLVEVLNKVGADARRVADDVHWMRSVLADRKRKALEELLQAALAVDSISQTRKGAPTDMPDACEEFVQRWAELGEEDSKLAAAHGMYDTGMNWLLYFAIVAGALLGATILWPALVAIYSVAAGLTLGLEVILVFLIHRARQLVVNERRNPRYTRTAGK